MERSGSVRGFLANHGEAYLRTVLVLGLNLPIIALLLIPALRGTQLATATLAYVGLVVLGYYALFPLIAITVTFCVSIFSRRLATLIGALLIAVLVYYFSVDAFVYGIYKFHLDAFWIVHIFVDYDTMGVPLTALLAALLLLVMAGALQVGLFAVARRVRRPGRVVAGFVGGVLLALAFSEAIHMAAYEREHSPITALTPRLPLYYPLTWHRQATKYGSLLAWAVGPAGAATSGDPLGLHYPLRPVETTRAADDPPPNIVVLFLESWRYDAMDPTVTPNIARLAARSTNFTRHFSSGNATPAGVFGLFYGIHPTYWPAVLAQPADRRDPVLMKLLKARGYALGIYSEHFERHKIAETLFHQVAVHDSFAGNSPDERDADMNRQMEAFISGAAARHQPFMAFEFYKSTHYAYYYPPASARFSPHQKLNVAMAGDRSAIQSYLNDYRNSVYYVDGLVGDVIAKLEAQGLMRNTIVVVTGDHGEEFNDDGAGYWGHASNFTQYQTRVPMVMYMPGQAARRVDAVTMHVDINATLVQAIAGDAQDPRDFSNGMNLFRPLPNERPVVASSYVNHAFILGDDVYSVFPMYVQRYRLDDVKAEAGRPRPDQARAAMEEITRFTGGRPLAAQPPKAPPPTHL